MSWSCCAWRRLARRRALSRRVRAVVAAAALLASAPVGGAIAFASPQRIIDAGLVVLVRTAGGAIGNGVVVGPNEVVTSCSVVSGAVGISIQEAWKTPVARPGVEIPATLAVRDEEGRSCLLFLEHPFWRSPPVPFAPASGSDSVASADGLLPQIFTVSVGEGYVLTVRRGLSATASRPVDRAAAAALASRPDPRPVADGAAKSLIRAGTAVFDEQGRLVGLIALVRPAGGGGGGERSGPNGKPAFPVIVPARDIAALMESSADWRACLAASTPNCVLDEAERIAIGNAVWSVETVAAARRDVGDHEGARALLRESAAALVAAKPQEPRALLEVAASLSDVGAAAAAQGVLREAEAAADRKWSDSAFPRIEFFGDLASVLMRAGAAGAAADLADKALGLVSDENDRDRTLRGASLVQAGAGQVGGALGAIESIVDPQQRRWALHDAVETLADLGDLEGAYQVAQRLRDAESRAYALEPVVEALAGRGETEEAISLAGASRSDEAKSHALRSAAEFLIRTGEFDAALEAALLMDDSWRRVEVLRWLARDQAKAGALRAALRTSEQLKSSRADYRTGPTGYNSCQRKPYCGALSDLAGIMAEAGEVALAIAAAERLSEPLDRLIVLAEVLGAGAAHDDPEVRTEVVELADQVVAEDARDLRAVVLAQAAVGDEAGAEATLRGISLSPRGAWGPRDQFDDPAFKRLRTDDALAGIGRAQAGAGRFSEALRTVDRIGDGFTRFYLIVDIAEAQVEAGDAQAARATFAKAVDLFERLNRARIRPVGGTHPLVWSLERLIHAQAEAGQGDEALKTLGRLELREGRGFSLHKVVHAASIRGEFDLALRAQSVLGRYGRVEALGYIARALAGLPPGDLPRRID